MPTEDQIQSLISQEFDLLNSQTAHVNNGSFGYAPKTVTSQLKHYSEEWIGNADVVYYNDRLKDRFVAAVNLLGSVANCEEPYTDHLTIIDNATTAAAILGKALLWQFLRGSYQPGDVIVMYDCAYGAVRKSFEHYLRPVGAEFVFAPTPFPLNDLPANEANEKIVDALRKTLDSVQKPIRLVLLEHVASEVSMVFPLEKLAKLCRGYKNVGYIYADAAHALGNVEVDLRKLDVHFYLSNCHKWFFCPQPCALFYSKTPFRDLKPNLELHHPIPSWNLDQGFFQECLWTGTRDLAPKFAPVFVPDAVEKIIGMLGLKGSDFKENLKTIRTYNHSKAVKYAQLLEKAWNTHVGTPPELMSSMAMIALPTCLPLDRDGLRLTMLNRFKVSAAFCLIPVDVDRNRKMYCRISHQVYVKEEWIHRLRDAVLEMTIEAKMGKLVFEEKPEIDK